MVCSVPLVKPAERDKLKKKDELLRDVLLEFVTSNRRKGYRAIVTRLTQIALRASGSIERQRESNPIQSLPLCIRRGIEAKIEAKTSQ